MALQWLKGTLAGFREFALAVKNEIVSLQPKDSDTIRWQRDYDGMSAHLNLDAIVGGSSLSSISEDAISEDSDGNIYLDCIHSGTIAIPIYSTVSVFVSGGLLQAKASPINTNYNLVYGVTTAEIAVNGKGKVLISGKIDNPNPSLKGIVGTTKTANNWVSAPYGRMYALNSKILLVNCINNPQVIVEYDGDFKIVKNNDNTVSVIQGSNPTGSKAGDSDVGSFEKTTIPYTSGSSTTIYAVVSYTQGTGYTRTIKTSYSNDEAYQLIGSITSYGKVNQQWQKGAINFGERWFV